ncbi:MAG TPA: hypothetical protein VFE65_06270 [Pseudonocardia sp.]|jgi:hypothetical protein|nr:hypothetical protein [Pseudonocardia sp.]
MPIKEIAPADDARHVLDKDRAFMRESLVWVVPLAAEGLGLVAYTWVDAFGKAGTAGIAFGPRLESPIFERFDDIPVPDDMTFGDWKAGPVRVALREPLRRADIGYSGQRLAMDFTFNAVHQPYAFSSHPGGFPLWFADDRFEQGGRAAGTARVDGEEISFDAFCHRDHSWGARAWAATLHYKWINFLAEDTSVHIMDLQGFGRSWPRGYVHKGGHTAEIVESVFDYVLDDDFYHRRFQARFTDDAGRVTQVRLIRSTAEIDYPISPRLRLYDIVGTGTIDDRDAVTYAEMAWPPDYLAANEEEKVR